MRFITVESMPRLHLGDMGKIKSKTVTEPAQGMRKIRAECRPEDQTVLSLSYGISKWRSALKISSPTRPLRAEP